GGHGAREVLDAHLAGGTAEALPGAREGSAEELEAHSRRLEEPRAGRAVRGRDRGDVRAHGLKACALARRAGRVQALRTRARARARDPRDRARTREARHVDARELA